MSRDARVQELFDHGADLPAAACADWLRRACGNDDALYGEVAALLAANAADADAAFWRRSAIEHEAAHLAAQPDPVIGATIGAYVIRDFIGSGGMGRVYRAARADAAFDRDVAIKRLNAGVDAAGLAARFRAERRILAGLDHPHIARLIDGGSDADGLPYLVMEYVEGVPPGEYCEAHAVSFTERLLLFRRIAAAVQYAHQRMVIHRDLKPGNVLITRDGTPKLLDFGIAKLIATDDAAMSDVTAAPLMTLRYASPEQIRGEALTTASDVYALGVLLYELLTGRSPYASPDAAPPVLMRAVCEETPIPPSVAGGDRRCRGDVDNIVLKALRKAPGERYTSVEQFSDDIRRYLDGRVVLARGESWAYRAGKFVRRNAIGVATAAAVVAALIAGIVMTRRAEALAERRFNDVRKLAHAVVFDYHDAIQDLPGATPVQKRLVKDALEYLDTLSREADTAPLRRELVDAYVRISNIQGNTYNTNLGDTAGAFDSAKKAVANADVLLARDRSTGSLRSSALAYSADASLRYASGDLTGADAEYRKAVQLEDEVQQREPANAENAIEEAETLSFLGDLYGGAGLQNLGKTGDAITYYKRAAAVVDRVLAVQPADMSARRRRHQTMLALAAAEAESGDIDNAMRGYREALGEIESIAAADPNNTLNQLELSNTSLRIGIQLVGARRSADAVPYIERAAGILERLSKADPQSALYKRNLSVVENHLANAWRTAGRAADALPHNRRSLQIAEALSAADPLSAEYRSDAGISHRKLAETWLALGRPDAADSEATIAAETLLKLGEAAHDASLEAQASRALLVRSDARRLRKEFARALTDAERGLAIAMRLSIADPVNASVSSDVGRAHASRAACLADMGRIGEAVAAFDHALERWDDLAKRHALTGEDDARADGVRRRVSALRATLER